MATETLFNLKELDAVFSGLKHSTQKSIVVSAFRKSSAPILDSAKSNILSRVKRRTGNLIKSLGVKPFRKDIGIQVGARQSKGFKGYHGHLIDAGTVDRYRTTKNGVKAFTGRIKAYRFWEDAINSNKDKVEQSVGDELMLSFDRYIDRNLKRLNIK
jgi:hypothetical protein